jgi:hypothetical protein
MFSRYTREKLCCFALIEAPPEPAEGFAVFRFDRYEFAKYYQKRILGRGMPHGFVTFSVDNWLPCG